MNDRRTLWLQARAKLNLSLRVVGRRADGYHLLDTVFHTVALHDDLRLRLAERECELEVSADDPASLVPAGPDNLVVRALSRLASAVGYRGGFVAHLHKRIPHGGGLGGGSSDAAAALRLANELLARPLDEGRLAAVAVGLGADVPFFLRGGSQRGRGIGDELEPVAIAPLHFVLVVPPFGCPTADVYKSFATLWKSGAVADTVRLIEVPVTTEALLRTGFPNDLQLAAERVRPELGALRLRVGQLAGMPVAMTGSGSTLFVPCPSEREAELCVQNLTPLRSAGVRLVLTRSAPGVDAPRPLAAAMERRDG